MYSQRNVRPGYDKWTPGAVCQPSAGSSPPPVHASFVEGASPHPNSCILGSNSMHGVASVTLKFMEKLTSARDSQPSDMNNAISLLRDEVL